MYKSIVVFFLAFSGVIIVDQSIKVIFLDGFRWYGEYFSLILTYNKGVAFSMLSFLDENLKYIQLFLIFGIFIYLIYERELFVKYSLPAGLILGAGSSNIYDRFIHGGVVDYFFWHKWFNFAVFNLADVMINIGVGIILLVSFLESKRANKSN